MAIKTHDKLVDLGPVEMPSNNAMIVEMIRTGLLYYFDGGKVVLLQGSEPSITDPSRILFPGKVIYDFQEKEEFNQILADDGDRYILEGITETLRVVSRFRV